MCQLCLDAVLKYFPDATDEEIHHILMCETAFPFSKPDITEMQVKEYFDKLQKHH